jgi:hypothetical protein
VYGNRNIWLNEAIASYAAERSNAKVAKHIEELKKHLGGLSERDREAVISALAESQGGSSSA